MRDGGIEMVDSVGESAEPTGCCQGSRASPSIPFGEDPSAPSRLRHPGADETAAGKPANLRKPKGFRSFPVRLARRASPG